MARRQWRIVPLGTVTFCPQINTKRMITTRQQLSTSSHISSTVTISNHLKTTTTPWLLSSRLSAGFHSCKPFLGISTSRPGMLVSCQVQVSSNLKCKVEVDSGKDGGEGHETKVHSVSQMLNFCLKCVQPCLYLRPLAEGWSFSDPSTQGFHYLLCLICCTKPNVLR